jgi:hypothetical protein
MEIKERKTGRMDSAMNEQTKTIYFLKATFVGDARLHVLSPFSLR